MKKLTRDPNGSRSHMLTLTQTSHAAVKALSRDLGKSVSGLYGFAGELLAALAGHGDPQAVGRRLVNELGLDPQAVRLALLAVIDGALGQ